MSPTGAALRGASRVFLCASQTAPGQQQRYREAHSKVLATAHQEGEVGQCGRSLMSPLLLPVLNPGASLSCRFIKFSLWRMGVFTHSAPFHHHQRICPGDPIVTSRFLRKSSQAWTCSRGMRGAHKVARVFALSDSGQHLSCSGGKIRLV